MKSPKENKPSLSDLFVSKKLDIPQDDFWDGFQDQVRSKTLSAVVKGECKSRIFKYSLISFSLILIFCFSFYFMVSPTRSTNTIVTNTKSNVLSSDLVKLADSSYQNLGKVVSSLNSETSNSFDTVVDIEVEAFTEQNFFASSLQPTFQYRVLRSDADFTVDSIAPFTF